MTAFDRPADEAPASLDTRVTATIGLHGSASTWVFNVTRRLLLAAHGEESVSPLYADRTAELPESPAPHLLVKSHHGSVELDEWLQARRATLILSIRDPRDAALSMAQRFESPLQHTAIWLRNDCVRLLKLLPESRLLLKYEDRYFEQPGNIERIAQCLDLPAGRELFGDIFDEFRTEAVRDFAARISQLPGERIGMVGKFPMDRVTQILARHIGDGRSGKWRELPLPLRDQMTELYRPFLERFDYPLA
ncbi:hypothetical protein [Rhodoblastus sp.]|uniref:hypothetical protein n=1 Tax=Rhodoblastus sp. TaxID=1962975 RepID=UPI003F9756FF